MCHLEGIEDGSEDVDLNRLLTWCLRLFNALAEVLKHLQSVFVCNVWKHETVESNRTVNNGNAEWQWTGYRLTLQTIVSIVLNHHDSKRFRQHEIY